MKTIYYVAGIFALALVVSGCGTGPGSADLPDFGAKLGGGAQVPAVATAASGSAIFWLNADGTELHYQLSVAEIHGVTMAHLHWGAFDTNGPPVAWLYPSAPPPKEIDGWSNGLLSQGMITAGDLVGPMKGKTIADLVAAIRAKDIYVNVHTHVYSDGEIRGQLE
jgi:hypothetical protein